MALTSSFLLISTVVFLVESSRNLSSPVKVSVYYECLCPDSIDFVNNQLWPNYENLKQSITMDFIPYGFAKQSKDASGDWKFTCQHGYRECRGNKYHACALDQKKGQNNDVAFISCAMKSTDPSDEGINKNCATENGYNWSEISRCYNGNRGSELIAHYGDRTNSLNLKFIPTIVFNDKFDQTLQDESIDNFVKAACSQISQPKPEVCNN